MNMPIVCCCDENPCPGSCNFASSYLMNNMSGTLQAVWRDLRNAIDCPTCGNGVPTDLIDDFELSVSWNLSAGATLTRYAIPGGGCCYAVIANLEVTWSWRSEQDIWCCAGYGTGSPYLCELDNTYSGTTVVPFCYTVVCVSGNGSKWKHSLTICDSSCDNVEVLYTTFLSTNGCGGSACNAMPVYDQGLRLQGACYSWLSTYKALDLLTPADYTPLGLPSFNSPNSFLKCSIEYPGQDPFGTDWNCMQTVVENIIAYGPFSPIMVPDWQTPDAPCTQVAEIPLRYTNGNCNRVFVSRDENWQFQSNCCDSGMSSTYVPPTFT